MLMLLYDLDSIDDLSVDVLKGKQYAFLPEKEKWRVNFISEIIDANNGLNVIPEFTKNELKDLVDFASTS